MRKLTAASMVFIAGFIMMVLEIIGARFLAKDFGSSFHVWVSQIGVVLIALAAGYYLGGALADRWHRMGFLSLLLVPAGLLLLFIPEWAGGLIGRIIERHPSGEAIPIIWQKLDPVFGSAVVFLMPCVVLAILSPYMIRLATQTLAQVGRSSGFIIAAGTLGSIAGVFVSGFILIDHMRISSIFRLMGALTVLLGCASLLLDRWLTGAGARLVRNAAALITGILVLLTPAPATGDEIFSATSPYHHIRVVDSGGMRTLCFDDATETRIAVEDPLKGHFEYTEYFHMPWLWKTNIQNVLMVGLGGGSTQIAFEHYYSGVRVDTVEIDPVVVRLARQYFSYKESDRQRVFVEDGRMFVRRTKNLYDLVLLDAYVQGRYGSSIPQHLATKEFFELARSRMTTNGVIAYNVIGSVSGWHADIVGAIYRTMQAVFPQVYTFPARSSQNVILVGTRAVYRAELPVLQQRAAELVAQKRITLPGFIERLASFTPVPPRNATRSPVLTDDYAPVEGLAAAGQ